MEKTLKTDRILLRKWQESDASALFALAKDPLVGESAGFPPHPDEAESLRVIREIFCKPETYAPETYAIVSTADGTLLGCITLFPGRRCDMVHFTEEVRIGYWLGRPYWGRGLMAEAVRLLCTHCFDPGAHFSCVVIAGYAKEGNVRSRRVLEKAGFTLVETKDGACRYELLKNLQGQSLRGWKWANMLIAAPRYAEQCLWDTLKSTDWERLLSLRPQFADKCDFAKLSCVSRNILLSRRPELASHCGGHANQWQPRHVFNDFGSITAASLSGWDRLPFSDWVGGGNASDMEMLDKSGRHSICDLMRGWAIRHQVVQQTFVSWSAACSNMSESDSECRIYEKGHPVLKSIFFSTLSGYGPECGCQILVYPDKPIQKCLKKMKYTLYFESDGHAFDDVSEVLDACA